MTKPKKYTPEFKAKVVLELLESGEKIGVVSAKYGLNPTMVSGWRRQLLDGAASVFSDNAEKALREEREKHEEEVEDLHRIIGRLTVERDYLQRSCRDIIGR